MISSHASFAALEYGIVVTIPVTQQKAREKTGALQKLRHYRGVREPRASPAWRAWRESAAVFSAAFASPGYSRIGTYVTRCRTTS